MSSAPLRLTRRQAIGLAAGGALGAAGLRLTLVHVSGGPATVASAAAGPAGAWQSPLSGGGRALAAHLLRRAGFGYSDAELDQVAGMAYPDLVDSLVNQRPEVPAAPADTVGYQSVATWWYGHMATTKAQFPERMTLFLHGLLTTDYRKTARFPYLYQQNQLYRRLGTGDLRSLLLEVTHDPAMMRYLDLEQSSAKAPNENYSRELMELYTLGVGNFTEQDVREGARALSGIRIVAVDSKGAPVTVPKRTKGMTQQDYYAALQKVIAAGAVFKGQLAPKLHDQGTKTFLGHTGNFGATEVIDAILAQDACAPFIARKALLFFSVPAPSDDYVKRIATALRDSKFDLRSMMRAIFLSDEFRAADNYRSLVRSPVDYMVATMRALGQPELARSCNPAGAGMNQVLYDPPTVAGWPVNGGWVDSGAWLARVNFAHMVANRGGSLPDPVTSVHNQLDGVVGSDTAAVFNGSQTPTDRWYAILASPEFQLK